MSEEITNRALRVLMLEDTPSDAELAERELRKAGIAFTSLRVETREAFVRALEEFHPDIILSDYNLPDFDGLAALAIVRRDHPQVPVIMVTGALADIEAVGLIHAGAKDYILKDRLARLAPAVQRALSAEQGIRARKAAEEKFRKISESAQDAIIMMADRRISFWNAAAERIFGYTAAEAMGQELHLLLAPASAHAAFAQGNKHFLESGEGPVIGKVIELTALRKGGEAFPVELSISSAQLDGQWHAISIVRDISERKRAQEQLQFSAARLNEAQHIAHLGSWTLDLASNALLWSDEIYRIFEIDPAEGSASYDAFLNVIHPDDRAFVNQAYMDSVRNHTPYNIAHRLLMGDGRVKYVQEICTTTYDDSGKPLRSSGTVQDITERRLTEIALDHANRALAALSAVNRQLVRAANEQELLQAICQAIVEQRGYRSAWVGYAQHDAEKTIRPMAQCGFEAGFLDTLPLTWADNECGQSPTGRAVRHGTVQFSQNILLDPTYAVWREQALELGFAASIALPLRNGDGVFGNLSIYAAETEAFDQAEIALLEEMAGDLSFGVRTLHIRRERDLALEQNQRQLTQLQDSLEDTVRAMAAVVEMRDPYTAGHQVRVAGLAAAIARQMGLPEERVHVIHLAGVVHDLGKIRIPAEILSKPGKITDLEFSLIKTHAQAGFDILKDIDFPWPIAQIVLQHHERLDGSGYPLGLKGEAILLEARILSVADVVEAMSSHRPYRPGLGVEIALAEITRQRAIGFDPAVVDACLAVFREQHYSFKN